MRLFGTRKYIEVKNHYDSVHHFVNAKHYHRGFVSVSAPTLCGNTRWTWSGGSGTLFKGKEGIKKRTKEEKPAGNFCQHCLQGAGVPKTD